MRDDPEPGLEIRFIFTKGAAAEAGLKAGDRIMKFGPPSAPGGMTIPMMPFTGRDQLLALLETQAPGSTVRLEVKRKQGGKTESVNVVLGNPDNSIPDELPAESSIKKALVRPKAAGIAVSGSQRPRIPPPGGQPKPPGPGEPKPPLPGPQSVPMGDSPTVPTPKDPSKIEKGLLKRTNQAHDHEFWVFVPENYDQNIAHGLVIWLHAAGQGGKDAEDVRSIWQEHCESNHLIMIGPKAENDTGWVASESEFIAGVARDLMAEYTIDHERIVVHGMGIGGQMAFYLGFNARDLVRGVATTSAVLATQPKDTVPNQRLSFFIVAGSKDPLFKEIAKSEKNLDEKKYPVVFRSIEMGKQYLNEKTLKELVRWIDCLDRM